MQSILRTLGLLLLVVVAPLQAQTEFMLMVENRSLFTICGVYAVPVGQTDAPNLMTAGDRLILGETRTFTLPTGHYTLSLTTCFGYTQSIQLDLTRGPVALSTEFLSGDPQTDMLLQLMRGFAEAEADGGAALVRLLDDMLAETMGIEGERGEIFSSLFGASSIFDFEGSLSDHIALQLNPVEILAFTQEMQGISTDMQMAMQLRDLGELDQAQARFDNVAARLLQYEDTVLFNQMGRHVLAMAVFFSGSIYAERGEYDRAVELLNEALAIEAATGDYLNSGYFLTNLGALYFRQGNYAQSIDALTRAVTIMRETNNYGGLVTALSNLGSQYLNIGLNTDALQYLDEALEVERTYPPDPESLVNRTRSESTLGIIHVNRGQAFMQAGLYADALTEFERARDEGLRLLAASPNDRSRDYHEILAFAYSGIGDALLQLGRVAEADQAHAAAVAQTENLNLPGTLGNTTLVRAVFLFETGRNAESYVAAERAYQVAQSINDRVTQVQALWLMARTLPEDAEEGVLINLLRSAALLAEATINDAGFERAVGNVVANFAPVFQDLSLVELAAGNLDEGFAAMERGRAIFARGELLGAPININAGGDRALIARENELNLQVLAARNRVNALSISLAEAEFTNTPMADRDVLARNLAQAQRDLLQAQVVYQQHIDTMQGASFVASELALRTASLAEVQAVLPPDTTLLIYATSSTPSMIYAVTADDFAFSTGALPTEIREAVRALRVNLADENAQRRLYDLLIGIPEVDEYITTSRVIIAPDGMLNYVPFAALRAPDGRYLIDQYALSIIPSGTSLVLLNERTPVSPQSPALAVAQPVAPGFTTLTGTTSEVESVERIVGGRSISNATESDLRANVFGSGILYIAAHGAFNSSAPLFSALYFAPDAQHDGILEVREIYELDLSAGTQLVILSACETNIGGAGDDYAQMNRAFLAAGANTVVSTLWSVEEESTQALMLHFLEARANTDNDADALQIAMRHVRDELGYTSPYYWAGVTLTGLPVPPSPVSAQSAQAVRPTVPPPTPTIAPPEGQTFDARPLRLDQATRVLACPDVDCNVIEELPPNSTIYLLELTTDSWLRVVTPNNQIGYIRSTFTTSVGP